MADNCTVEEYLKYEYGKEKWSDLSEKTKEQIPICCERCPYLLHGGHIKNYGSGKWTRGQFEDHVQVCYDRKFEAQQAAKELSKRSIEMRLEERKWGIKS
jgi:hypothetical protein